LCLRGNLLFYLNSNLNLNLNLSLLVINDAVFFHVFVSTFIYPDILC
jgi:hypothetical protein